uniref:non-specific serine/threonine protein kinase n=1 Tax=Cuerna arida TaxID=1464854 RepID=A0A1B6H149_9HEMI
MNINDNYIPVKQGAEGKLYKGIYLGKEVIVKERFKKLYRHQDLDEHLTRERMKAEAKAIIRSKNAGVHTPAIYLVDFDNRLIVMEEIENSVTVKDYINKVIDDPDVNESTDDKLKSVSSEIGSAIAKLHKHGIVHGDLTSSNMLVREDEKGLVSKLFLIDFGLSQLDASPEDKGVDLYVLERALVSTHKNAEELFKLILDAYKKVYKKGGCPEVLSKLEEVRARGRKRTMVG